MSIRKQFVSTFLCGLFATSLSAQQLAIVPATPTPLDLVRLRYTHVGCTNPDSLQLTQSANRITVQAERILFPDCGTIVGYYEEFTLGRLPTGNYDAELVVNPPAGTLGPSVLVGVAHFSVARLPPTASLHPHENYSDSWWNPQESGWALNVFHAGDTLIANWAVYDASGQPTWYALLSGAWRRDANNMLMYGGTIYRTGGPYWGGAYSAKVISAVAVGSGDFQPTSISRAIWSFTIDGIHGSKTMERFHF